MNPISRVASGLKRRVQEPKQRFGGRLAADRLLLPVIQQDEAPVREQAAVATMIAEHHEAALLLMNPITLPRELCGELRFDLNDDPDETVPLALASLRDDDAVGPLPIRWPLVGRLQRAIETREIDTVVLPTEDAAPFRFRRDIGDALATRLPADALVIDGDIGTNLSSVLLPVAGGPNAGLATDVAHTLAVANDAWIDVVYVDSSSPDAAQMAEQWLATARDRLDPYDAVDTEIIDAASPVDAIIDQAQYHDLTVLGGSSRGGLQQLITDTTAQRVRDAVTQPVLTVWNNRDRQLNNGPD